MIKGTAVVSALDGQILRPYFTSYLSVVITSHVNLQIEPKGQRCFRYLRYNRFLHRYLVFVFLQKCLAFTGWKIGLPQGPFN